MSGKNKKLADIGYIYVELNAKGSSFTDPLGGVSFKSSNAVQKVRKTPMISRGINEGQLSLVDERRFNEFTKEREAYIEEYKAAKAKKNLAAQDNAVTFQEKFKAQEAKLATLEAEVARVEAENTKVTKELESLKKSKK